jgi:dTDP-4-dehydrorhamnose reductase
LVTGRDGQVGWELQSALAPLGVVTAVSRKEMDLTSAESVRACIRSVRPNLIVNAAAYTAVDKAEAEPELARRINADAVALLADEAKRLGAAIIHYSTDYVFDGAKATPYVEEDTPHPLSVYGRTKLAGEQVLAAWGVPYLVLRTSWVYGARGRNFLLTILKLAAERDELRIVDDQTGAPTWSREIATATATIAQRWLLGAEGNVPDAPTTSAAPDALTEPTAATPSTASAALAGTAASAAPTASQERLAALSGIYHLTAAGETTWHGFAAEALRLYAAPPAGQRQRKEEGSRGGKGAEADSGQGRKLARLVAIPSSEYPTPAARPRNSRLDCSKLARTFAVRLPDWRDSLSAVPHPMLYPVQVEDAK